MCPCPLYWSEWTSRVLCEILLTNFHTRFAPATGRFAYAKQRLCVFLPLESSWLIRLSHSKYLCVQLCNLLLTPNIPIDKINIAVALTIRPHNTTHTHALCRLYMCAALHVMICPHGTLVYTLIIQIFSARVKFLHFESLSFVSIVFITLIVFEYSFASNSKPFASRDWERMKK